MHLTDDGRFRNRNDFAEGSLPPLPNLTSLEIRRWNRSADIERLIERLPNLATLAMYYPASSRYDELPYSIMNQHTLKSFTLFGGSDVDLLLAPLLGWCEGITVLSVNACHLDLRPELREAFRQSSILSLTLSDLRPYTSADDILSLISGDARIRTLRTLSLRGATDDDKMDGDLWQPKIGISAERCIAEGYVEHLLHSWRLPEWGLGMEGRAEEIVEAATKGGIKLEGSILEGIEGERRYRAEEVQLQRLPRESGEE